MAWSAKLISGAGGVANFNEWEMFFDPATQTAYKITYNVSLGSEAPDVLYHTPDNGSPLPIRATGRNRIIFLELHIPPQTSWDNVLNKIAPIARLVDGADSQSMRAQTGGADAVKVAIKPDGATYTTYFDVLHGFIDTSQAFTQDVSMLNKMAYRVTVALTCKPYGYGDAFTLNNALPSSPHMIEGGASTGLAHGWTLTGTPTVTLSTTRFLTGGKSQRFITDDSTSEGINSPEVTIAIDSELSAIVAIAKNDNDPIGVVLRDGADTAITSKYIVGDDINGVALRTVIGSDGAKWYIVHVSGVNSGAADAYVQVWRRTQDATQISATWVDIAYLQVGTLVAPPAWSSSNALNNRYDPAATSAATRQQINYLDVWGVPGDVPALARYTITPTGGQSLLYTASKYSDNIVGTTTIPYWIDSDEFAAGTGSTWTTGTGTTKNHFFRLAATESSGMIRKEVDWKYFTNRAVKLFAIIRASATASNVVAGLYTKDTSAVGVPKTLYQSSAISVTAANTWQLHDFGLVNATGITEVGQSIPFSLELDVTNSGANTFDIDAVFLLPTDEFIICDNSATTGALSLYPPIIIDGVNEVCRHGTDYLLQAQLGTYWNMNPGAIVTRHVFLPSASYSLTTYDIATAYTVVIVVTPRTSHLLGTV